jgi:hypothetical protein
MIRKDKRSNFGGKLGEEFNAIWDALSSNQIIPADGLEVKHTSSGTVVKAARVTSSAGGKGVIQTKVADFPLASYSPSQQEEAWFVDEEARIIAYPPVRTSYIDLARENFFFKYADLYFASSSEELWAYPHAHARDMLGYEEQEADGFWNFIANYMKNDMVLIVPLSEPLRIPLGETMRQESDFATHYTEKVDTAITTSLFPNGIPYIEADYLDLNMDDRIWG